MDKLTMAHEFMMKKMETETIDNHWELFYSSWRYADAMQAEADKRISKERPDVLCEVDWHVAPNDAIGWMIFDGVSTWLGDSGYLIEDAPSFGFSGTHIMERPHGI